MQRLADEVLDNAIEVLTVSSECCGGFDDPFEEVKFRFLKELKQYRDLGLEPLQLAEIDRLYQSKCEEVVALKKELKTQRYLHDFWLNSADDARKSLNSAHDKTREYQQKLADGRMVELPCKCNECEYAGKANYHTDMIFCKYHRSYMKDATGFCSQAKKKNTCLACGCDCYNSEVGGCEMPSEDLMLSCPLESGEFNV